MPGPLGFVVAFLVFIIVAAIVILGIRWLIKVSGVTVSPELNLIISLVLLLFLILVFFYAVPWHAWGFWR
jgi:hypothetical protein